MNQQIVYINREEDLIIVQDKNPEDVYQDTLANFITDGGTAIPDYITSLDYCVDTKLRILNGERIELETPHAAEAIAYANALIPTAGTLKDAQTARNNPPQPEEEEPELTPDEQQRNALEEQIWEKKDYLQSTDYAVIKCLERGLDIETEYPGLKTQRQAARDAINTAEAQVALLETAIASANTEENADA